MRGYAMHLLVFTLLVQVVIGGPVGGQTADGTLPGDNDESPTSTLPPPPPIQHQFALVSSQLSPTLKVKETGGDKRQPETETGDNEDEEDENPTDHGRRLSFLPSAKKGERQSVGGTFQQAVGCGYFRMKGGDAISIQSTNFNSGGSYRNYEQCTWKFFGQQCKVKASCPCFKLPSTPNCSGDLLKLTDQYSFAHKFCGSIIPLGTYNSTTNNLKVHFRADGQTNDGGQGFRCYVTCTAYGKTDPVQLATNSTVCSN